MINLKLVSKKGNNYFFLNGELYGLEDGVFNKIDQTSLCKIPICYGGIKITLFNGSNLYFNNDTFYIKEW